MSAEAKFRRAFETALRRHTPFLSYMSSMNVAGVPDEYMLVDGHCYWIELKAVAKWPVKPTSNILEHRFSGPQLTYLQRVDRAGGRGLGVIGWRDGRKWVCACLRTHDIGSDGTVTKNELDRHPHFIVDDCFHSRFLRLVERS
jgi:hypothetical protein